MAKSLRESSSSPKPWKNTRSKKKVAPVASASSIEIFESKPTVPTRSFLESTPADHKSYLRILCKDDDEFLVPTKVVERLKCLDVILNGQVEFKETLENVIRFPDFRAEVLESVMRFVFIEHLDCLKAEKYWGENAPRVAFQFEVEPSQVMELVYAAHFFGIKNLLSVAAAMIAHHFKDVPDVSSMPPDLAWCVAEQFSAQDLFDAEERDDFLSLSLDTSSLWEKHCKRLLQDCTLAPVSSLENYPKYDEWQASEGPPPTSWKSLYVSVYLQQLADKQDGSKLFYFQDATSCLFPGTNKAFLDEVAYKGKWVYAHTVRSTFSDWVMAGEGSLAFDTYASHFPKLFSLCLAKVPLRNHLKDGLDFAHLLEGMPYLQLLDISETGFTKEAAASLSKALKFHERLQVLRAAYNCIMTEGYAAILQALPSARSLKVLDVRGNGIGVKLPENIHRDVKASAVEELFLDGNCTQESSVAVTFGVGMMNYPRSSICSSMPATLKALQLQQCNLSDYHITILAQALANHTAIQKMDLSDNKITSDGARAIFIWLQENISLMELYLANNNITDSCSGALRIALCSHHSLEKLSLMGNYSYGEESIPEVISTALQRGDALLASKQKKFKLDLRCTDVSYANIARIRRQAANYVSLEVLL